MEERYQHIKSVIEITHMYIYIPIRIEKCTCNSYWKFGNMGTYLSYLNSTVVCSLRAQFLLFANLQLEKIPQESLRKNEEMLMVTFSPYYTNHDF